jgi:hypothetical protein
MESGHEKGYYHVISLFFLYEALCMSLHPPPYFGGIIYGAIRSKNSLIPQKTVKYLSQWR